MENDFIYGVIAVIGGILIHFTYGHFYTISNIVPYVMSYLRAFKQLDLNDSLAIWLPAAALAMQGVGMPLGGMAAKKIGVRAVVAISCLINSGFILVTYFSVQHSFATFVVTYAVLVGFGFGFAYSVVLAAAVSWFPDRRGLIVGLIVGGFGLGALVCTPIQTAYVNPDNVQVNSTSRDFADPALLHRVPKVFLVMGGILLSLQLIGFILLRPRPISKNNDSGCSEDAVKQKLNPTVKYFKGDFENNEEGLDIKVGEESNTGKGGNQKIVSEISLAPKQMLKCIDFYILWFIMFCNIIPITIITSAHKLFGQKYIDDDFFLSMVVTITSVFNSCGRVIWGFLVDKLSFKIPLLMMLGLWSVTLISFPHLAMLPAGTLKAMFVIWSCLLFFSLSGVFAIMPAATGSLFGAENLATNYGIVYTAFAVGGLLCATITTLVNSKGAYLAQFTGCGIVCIVAIFATMWLEDRKIRPSLNCFKWFESCCPRFRLHRSATSEEDAIR